MIMKFTFFLRKIFHAAWKFHLLLKDRVRTLSSPFACVVFFIRISFLYLLHFSRIPIVMYPNWCLSLECNFDIEEPLKVLRIIEALAIMIGWKCSYRFGIVVQPRINGEYVYFVHKCDVRAINQNYADMICVQNHSIAHIKSLVVLV